MTRCRAKLIPRRSMSFKSPDIAKSACSAAVAKCGKSFTRCCCLESIGVYRFRRISLYRCDARFKPIRGSWSVKLIGRASFTVGLILVIAGGGLSGKLSDTHWSFSRICYAWGCSQKLGNSLLGQPHWFCPSCLYYLFFRPGERSCGHECFKDSFS